MDTAHKPNVAERTPDTKEHILQLHLYKIQKQTILEVRFVVTFGEKSRSN